MNITTENRKWLEDLHLNHPLVIAGPCSAETEDQVLKIAHELQNSDVSIFRAGICLVLLVRKYRRVDHNSDVHTRHLV